MKKPLRSSLASVLVLSLIPTFAMAKDPASKAKKTSESVESQPSSEDIQKDDDEKIERSYEGGIRGLKALMKNLKEENPKVHETLLPDYTKLRRRYNTGAWISWSSTIVGLGLAGFGFARFVSTMGDDDSGPEGFGLFAIGAGIPVIGYFVSAPFFPSEQDYKNFTNKHNKINKKSQIRWERASLMLNENKLPMLALGFSF